MMHLTKANTKSPISSMKMRPNGVGAIRMPTRKARHGLPNILKRNGMLSARKWIIYLLRSRDA